MLDRLRTTAVAAATSLTLLAPCVALAGDPKVPPGQDPGGTAIALIGGGLDYTDAKIAPRLARDGEGELIGWDMVDNDRAPFVASVAQGDGATDGAAADAATATAQLLLSAYSKGRLIPLRVPPGDAQALAKAIAFTAGTPARIVAIATPLDTAALRTVVRQASERFTDHVFVVAGNIAGGGTGGANAAGAAGEAGLPSLMNLRNVLVVAALEDAKGKPIDDVIKASDLLVMPRGGTMFAGIVDGAPPRDGREAVALAAAAAACQGHGREAPLLGSAAKAATLDAARPLPDMRAVRVLDPMCWYGGVRY